MSGSEGRSPRDLQDLLRFSIQQSVAGEGDGGDGGRAALEASTMDPERRRWLAQAINSMTYSPVEEIQKTLHWLNERLQAPVAEQEADADEVEEAVDKLIELVGSIDFANDCCKVGGLTTVRGLLASNFPQFMSKGCELLAEMVQNNSFCQNMVMNEKILPTLTLLLDKEENQGVRVKALYAISCLIRDNDVAQKAFESQLDGFSVLLRAMQSETENYKLRIKASFLMTALCQQHPHLKETFYKMGLVEQLVALLQSEHNPSHEHLMAALHALISQHEPSLGEARRSELQLEELLRDRHQYLEGKPEFTEEREFCENLLNMCFPSNEGLESER